MKQLIQRILITAAVIFILPIRNMAQCAMCQATVESSKDSGSTAAAGLNDGILYMLFMPIIFGALMFFIWKRRERELKRYEEQGH